YEAGSDETARAMGYADGLGLRTYVTGLGYVPDGDLPELYRRARATLVLSRSEGFAFPVLESMACGTPVIHSAAGAVSEAAGGAGIEVPDDEEEIARAMTRVHADESFRAERIAKGLERAAQFRWSKTADRLLELFAEVGGSGAGDARSAHGASTAKHAVPVGSAH
ncbi:MAG TPA: glycosyltransferase, partial [Planctomycetota bacterium]|nr:glycosyltransferase [Planctomycetota bacterium]